MMVKTVDILASDTRASVECTIQELFESRSKVFVRPITTSHMVVEVEVGSGAQSVSLSTRPVATERAVRIQRLNRALELGYTPPLISTTHK